MHFACSQRIVLRIPQRGVYSYAAVLVSRVSWAAIVAAALLSTHAVLLVRLALRQSPNIDELAHIASGMAIWQYGLFDVYVVNPPLVRAIATLPLCAMPHQKAWGDFEHAPKPRPEFVLGAQFVESHPDVWRSFLISARLALLPFAIVGGLCCYCWSRDLFGSRGGLLALTLWCFCPNLLTWSSLICTDGPAASVGVVAGYMFWRWITAPSWGRAILAATALAAAVLTKLTWLVLFAVWPALGIWACASDDAPALSCWRLQFIAIFVFAVYAVNFAYGFDGTLTPLGDFKFRSRLLSGQTLDTDDDAGANRFAKSALRWIPVPLPAPYVRGIDLQRRDFEVGGPSYLFGQWHDRGWWYYYLVGFAIKMPLGTLGLGVLSAVTVISAFSRRLARRSGRGGGSKAIATGLGGRLTILAPPLAVLALVSSQDGFSAHFRYAVPAVPFAFVAISQVATHAGRGRPMLSACIAGLLAWSVGSTFTAFPHTMAYFNWLAGGSARGDRFMLGSSFSWAQDQFELKEWLHRHPEVDCPYVCVERSVSLERLGIRSRGEPPKALHSRSSSIPSLSPLGPVAGWHVIDVPNIHARDGGYRYFSRLEPEVEIGTSIRVYHLTTTEANRIRRDMRLPTLANDLDVNERFLDELASGIDSSRDVAVALFTADGDVRHRYGLDDAISRSAGLSCQVVRGDDVRNGVLADFDVLVVPGGSARAQIASLGSEGKAAIRRFVHDGHGYVGICAGAYLGTSDHDQGLGLVNARAASGQRFVPGVGTVSASFRGWGRVTAEVTALGEVAFAQSVREIALDYTGGPIFSRANEPALPDYVTIASFRSEVYKYAFQKGAMVDTPAILAGRFGQGRVILFSAHPESVTGGESLLADAIRACRNERPR